MAALRVPVAMVGSQTPEERRKEEESKTTNNIAYRYNKLR
jgi:hypothetical protein